MMRRYACHGLGVLQPIDLLVADIERQTPDAPRFNIVGGFSPPLEEQEIIARMKADHAAGHSFLWIGHSMGAALGYYLATSFPDWHFNLVIAVDPMNWASNIKCREWQRDPLYPGHWAAQGHYDRWINIHTDQYPGGGVIATANDRCEDHHFPDCDHISVIADPRVRKIIFDAVGRVSA